MGAPLFWIPVVLLSLTCNLCNSLGSKLIWKSLWYQRVPIEMAESSLLVLSGGIHCCLEASKVVQAYAEPLGTSKTYFYKQWLNPNSFPKHLLGLQLPILMFRHVLTKPQYALSYECGFRSKEEVCRPTLFPGKKQANPKACCQSSAALLVGIKVTILNTKTDSTFHMQQ